MGKLAFMFPGQGAQYVGMGKEFYDNNPKSREIFETASKAVGLDMEALCFEENEVYAMNLSFLTHLQSVNPIIISESSCFNSTLQQTSQIYQIIRKIIADHQ